MLEGRSVTCGAYCAFLCSPPFRSQPSIEEQPSPSARGKTHESPGQPFQNRRVTSISCRSIVQPPICLDVVETATVQSQGAVASFKCSRRHLEKLCLALQSESGTRSLHATCSGLAAQKSRRYLVSLYLFQLFRGMIPYTLNPKSMSG